MKEAGKAWKDLGTICLFNGRRLLMLSTSSFVGLFWLYRVFFCLFITLSVFLLVFCLGHACLTALIMET